MLDPATPQVGSVSAGGVGTICDDPVRADTGTTDAPAGHTDTGQHRRELRAVAAGSGGEQHRQRPTALLAAQRQLGGPAAAGAAQGLVGWFRGHATGALALRLG